MPQTIAAIFHGGFVVLVLSRKVGERLVIGNDVAVVVTKVAGNRVTLGVEAPKSMRVLRGELRRGGESDGGSNDQPGNK